MKEQELVKRLYEGVADTGVLIKSAATVNADMHTAADLIERQAAEIERLSSLCDKWNTECDEMREDNKRLAGELEKAENLLAIDIHSCHPNCTNSECVNRRLREQVERQEAQWQVAIDALQAFIDEHEECEDADGWMAFMCSPEAYHVADEALATLSDPSAILAERDARLLEIRQAL